MKEANILMREVHIFKVVCKALLEWFPHPYEQSVLFITLTDYNMGAQDKEKGIEGYFVV